MDVTGTTATYALVGSAIAGLSIGTDGSWSFDPAVSAYQPLAQGETQIVTVNYSVTDNNGASDTESFSITVTGTNDAAVITGDTSANVTEDGTLAASGTLSVSDADTAEGSFESTSDPIGTYGSFTFDLETGAWEYTLDNDSAVVQALPQGQTVTDTLTVTTDDGTTETITVTINGTNDAPTLAVALVNQSATEDLAFSFTVPAGTFADVDAGDTLIFSATLAGGAPLQSWLSFDAATGSFSGTPVNGDVGTISVTVTATDLSAASVSDTFNITVANVNDPPAAVNDTFTVAQNDTTPALNFLANDTDPDGNILSITSIAGTTLTPGSAQSIAIVNGTINVSATGLITFTPTVGYSGSVSFDYTIADGQSASATATVVGTVTSVDAPPVTVVELEISIESFVVSGEYVIESVSQATSIVDATGALSAFELLVDGVLVEIPAPGLDDLDIDISDGSEGTSASGGLVVIGAPSLFTLDINTNDDGTLADADPREGTQVVVTIDLSDQEGLVELEPSEIYYAKYYSQVAIDAAIGGLRGLDGEPIVEEGWYPFNRLQDENGLYYGDGAQFVVGSDGSLTLEIHLTDNEFGDTNPVLGGVTDPGILYSLVASDSPDNVTPPPDQPAPQSGVFELASVGSTDSTFASVATAEEAVTVETVTAEATADSGATSGSTKPDSSLVQAYAERAFDDLMSWAASSGLISRPADGQDASTGAGNTTTNEPRPLAFVSQALGMEPGLASGILEALALGGASLYAINRFGGGRLSAWVRKLLLPAAPQVAAATAERIVVVFKLLSQAGLQCLVAARVDADKLEILAEQALPMSLSAAAAPSQVDLAPHLRKLVERVSNQTGTHDLLLYDPHLRQELPLYESLGRMQAELRPQSLDGILASLGPDQLVELRSWITRPSGTDLRQHPVGDRLERRQRELRQRMDTDKASLVSLLELSLALGQRFA